MCSLLKSLNSSVCLKIFKKFWKANKKTKGQLDISEHKKIYMDLFPEIMY